MRATYVSRATYMMGKDRETTESTGKASTMAPMHETEYTIFGDDMQYVEVELDPDEATVAEAGAMMYMEDGA